MRAGELDQRVTIEAPGSTQPDASGSYNPSFTLVATVWAKVEAGAGSESAEMGKATARQGYRVTMRHRAGLTTRHRLLWTGRILEITAIDHSRRRQGEIILECMETK